MVLFHRLFGENVSFQLLGRRVNNIIITICFKFFPFCLCLLSFSFGDWSKNQIGLDFAVTNTLLKCKQANNQTFWPPIFLCPCEPCELVLKSNVIYTYILYLHTYIVTKHRKIYFHWYISSQIYQENLLFVLIFLFFSILVELSSLSFLILVQLSEFPLPGSKIQAGYRTNDIMEKVSMLETSLMEHNLWAE